MSFKNGIIFGVIIKMGISYRLLIFIIILLSLGWTAEARHLKLYGTERPRQGTTWVTYTSDYIPAYAATPATGNVGSVMYHEIEIETGITDRWSQSVYFDADSQAGSPITTDNNFRVNLIKTEFNYAVSENNWFDFRINNEWAFKTGAFTDPLAKEPYSNSIELRPIFSKSIGKWTFIIGPGFFYRYSDVPIGLTYFYANAIQYDISDTATFGLEFHGDLGTMQTATEQSHFIVPNLDIQLNKNITLSIGVGFGLNAQAEQHTYRASLQIDLGP